MKLLNNISLLGILAFVVIMSGCDKTKPYDVQVPPPLAHFVGAKTQIYSVIVNPPPLHYVVVGTTDVSNVDRTVTFNVTSTSGAIAGTDYTLNRTGTVTIPAGKTMDTIAVTGVYSSYSSGQRDTLVFTLAQPSIDPASFSDTVRLILAGPTPCDEGNPTLNDVLGNYANTNELFATNAYGPYNTSISAVNVTGPTTGTIVVENIWDNGWGPITFNLNWTDPTNRTCVVVPQAAIPGSNAGDINSTYAGQTIAVRVPSAALSPTPGTYSFCNMTFTLKMQLGVTGLGYFNALYTVNMAR